MRSMTVLAALLAASTLGVSAARAQSGYATVTYHGSVSELYDPTGFTLDEPITYTVTFNPASLTDRTASANAVLHGPHINSSLTYDSVYTASLADDPHASLTITIGDDVFTKTDELGYGTPKGDAPFDLGVGNFPIVEYLNGAFAGIGGSFADANGITLYTDPIAAALGYFDGHSFYVGTDDGGAEGDYSLAGVAAPALPEPASWAMMIGGLGVVGTMLRRRPRPARRAAAIAEGMAAPVALCRHA